MYTNLDRNFGQERKNSFTCSYLVIVHKYSPMKDYDYNYISNCHTVCTIGNMNSSMVSIVEI